MTLRDEDVASLRRAVQSLQRAADAATRHYGDTVDRRRLQADVSRLGDDIDLLCGRAAAPSPASPPQQREVIRDTEYAHDFWMDAQDEGLGGSG